MVRMVVLYPVKIGVLALLFWYLLGARLQGKVGVIAAVVLAILFHIGIVAILTSVRRRRDSKLLKNSLRGEIPRDGRRIAVAGTIEAQGDLLETPFSLQPCVLYSYEIYRMVVTPSRGRGSSSSSRRVVDFSGLAMTSTAIRTSNGRFALCGFPYLTGVVRNDSRDVSLRVAAREYIRRTTFEKTLPYAGELAALDGAMKAEGRSIRLDSQMTDGSQLEEGSLLEEYVADGTRACAFGCYSAASGGLVPGRGAEDRIHLMAGEGEAVLQRLASGARYSQAVAAIMMLIVGAAVAFVFLASPELIERISG